jgi:hypothetical protein
MLRTWIKRLLYVAVIALLGAASLIIARTNPEPWTKEEIVFLTQGLNEAAAISVPHGYLMSKGMREANLAVLEKVESGTVLDASESKAYRHIFQQNLQESQNFLARFDAELSVIPDHAMQTENNIAELGIAGHHDHHDLSARKNFAGLLASLAKLETASNSFGRIRFANAVQKDLVDLISHMGVAPNTISVPYQSPEMPWPDSELGQIFEDMMKAFKQAQFENVNAPAYWAAVDVALAKYAELIWTVQTRVNSHTAVWERRIAGRFLSMQTLAPPVEIKKSARR